MKRVGYLFEEIVDPENLRLFFLKACHISNDKSSIASAKVNHVQP